MPEKTRIPSIPLIGKSGLLAILGCIVGVIVDRLLENVAMGAQSWMKKEIYEGFHIDDLIALVIPLVLMVVVKRFRAFFIGWFVGALATEVYEWAHGLGGYTKAGIAETAGV